jgi:hypothetical protein
MNLFRNQNRRPSKASILVLLALLLAFAPTLTLNAQQPGTAIIFSAQPQVSDELWPTLFEALRTDVAAGGGELPNGFALDRNLTLLRARDVVPGIEFEYILQVKLLGRCDVVPQAYRPMKKGPLGWVTLDSGHILPFVSIDCTLLAQVLGPTALGLDKEGRRHVMSQAIAHILIHEWIHIATQNATHGAHGIMKASISVKELIADPSNNRLLAVTQ